jgi:tetratricopeptide (TPR) repeat protein
MRLNEVLELGLEVAEPGLADLPWEALQIPEPSGEVADIGGSPLALHRNVALYRQVAGQGTSPAHKVKGPLRLLVAIASPETGGGELLDYEAELARIVAAVEPARKKGQAYVRVLNEGSLAAINTALSEDREGFHILHLSCHAQPGELVLETADGDADLAGVARLLEEGVPAGADLPMVVLSGCSTGLAARQRRLHPGSGATVLAPPEDQRLKQEQGNAGNVAGGEGALASFAAGLIEAGVPQVLAMQAPVSDRYATNLCAELYHHLATDASPDPLLALAEARRLAERKRLDLPADSPRRGPAEWTTPALLARGLRLPLFNRDEPAGPVRPPQAPVLAEGVVVRDVGEFVGRRREVREARRALAGQKAGLVVHGIGGVGKSTLAAEVLRSLGDDAGLVVSRAGQLSVDDVLKEVGARLQQASSGSVSGEDLAQAALILRAGDVEWADRWRLLVEQILPELPMIVLLDNFEDNLHETGGEGWQVRDPELAEFLAGWVRRPGQSRLLFTSRYPFTLPKAAQRRLADLHLGPLSVAETSKLIWRLPGLDALPAEGKDRAYRNVGGHPRTLEYLDALLQGGAARFDDVAQRMEDRLAERGIADPAAWLAAPGRDLDANLAEAVTLAVDDILLSRLLDHLAAVPLATELVTGAAVYRVPIDDTALLFQVGQRVERPADPERRARISRVLQVVQEAAEQAGGRQITLEDTGLTAEDYDRYQADVAEERRPPVEAPDGLAAAVAAARAAGLLTPVPRGREVFHFVHRWTAAAIAKLHPDATAQAHQQAAAFWHWRVDTIPQSREQDTEQLLEARYHHHAAGQTDQAVTASEQAVGQMETLGEYGRAMEICREALTWLPPDSFNSAVFQQWLGNLATRRGDYDTATASYRQALEAFERLDDQAGLSSSYHGLGMIARYRGDYADAESLYRRSLEIDEHRGDQDGVATSYHQLGIVAHLRGDYDAAESSYRRALEIKERLNDQAGMSAGYHQLGVLAQENGDYAAAERHYLRSLEIDERRGDQTGIAASYHQLGILAHIQEDYDTAGTFYRQSLEIRERTGDQAGIASDYHQLGRLAADQGDYDTARFQYQRSLEIGERLGDLASVATDYASLGSLSAELGDLDQAVAYRVGAVVIRLKIGTAKASEIQQLAELRRTVGDDRFRAAALAAGLDAESTSSVMEALDEYGETATG